MRRRTRFVRRADFQATIFDPGTTALLAPAAFARTISEDLPWLPGRANEPSTYTALRFFTAAERRCVDAITARMIPSDGFYVRSSWGNAAPAVSARDVADLREALKEGPP